MSAAHDDAALFTACDQFWSLIRETRDGWVANFDARVADLEATIYRTAPTTMTAAAAQLRVALNAICQSVTVESSLMVGELPAEGHEDLCGGDALIINIIRFLEGEAPAGRWDSLFTRWAQARREEVAFAKDVLDPVEQCADVKSPAAAAAIYRYGDRLSDKRDDAETPLMAEPAPNASAFALKFLIAFGSGREANAYQAALEADARRMAGINWEEFAWQ